MQSQVHIDHGTVEQYCCEREHGYVRPSDRLSIWQIVGVLGLLVAPFLLAVLLLWPAIASAQVRKMELGGPPKVTANDSVYGSHAGKQWDTYLNKSQKTFGAWNPTSGKAAINRLVGASYAQVTKSGNTITVADAWPGVDYSVTFSNSGWDESGTIADASGMTFQVYRATDLPNVSVSGDTIFYNAAKTVYITPMIAVDVSGDTLTVTQTVTSLGIQQGLPTWRVTYAIDTAGVVYPVTFDPSVTINPVATHDGSVYTYDRVAYATARDTTSGMDIDSGILVGQITAGLFDVYRGWVPFDISTVPSDVTVDSVVFSLNGDVDQSTTDFFIQVYSGLRVDQPPTKPNFIMFDGRTSGSAHTGVALTDSVSSANYVDETYWAVFHFNAAGIDTLEARIADGDTLKLAILSREDVTNSAPTGSEKVNFHDDNDAGKQPKLTVYYHLIPGIDSLTALDSTKVRAVLDTSGLAFVPDSVTYHHITDSALVVSGGAFAGLYDTVTVAYADSLYRLFAKFWDGASPTFATEKPDSARTRAANTAPTVLGWTQKSGGLLINQSINRPATMVAVLCSTATFGPRTITATGDTAALADTTFQTFLAWGTDTLFTAPRFSTILYIWQVAKNGDSLMAARSATMSDSLFGAITFTAGFLDSVRVTGTTSIASVPSRITTLDTWLSKSSATVADSAVSDTSTLDPGTSKLDTASSKVALIRPNSVVALRAVVKLNNHDSLAASGIDSIFTDPDIRQFTLSIVHTADTAMVPTIGIGTNPGWTRFTLIDSALVDAESTKVYYGPTALSATPTWYDTLYFTGTAKDTLIWPRGSGHIYPDSTDIFIIAASGDSTQGAP